MAKRKNITTTQLALMTAAAVISLRGLPMMAQEELTMFFYIFFATFLFLIPAALVGAELGSAFADRGGGVYTWVKEAFNRHLGFSAIFLQWIQNVVWYPTVLGFAAASIAYMIGVPALAQNGLYVGLFSIAMYWCATLVTLRGTSAISGITSKGFLIGTVLPGVVVIVMAVIWMAGGNEIALKEIPAGVSQIVNVDAAQHVHPRLFPHITGMSDIAFLAGILLLFAGVEVHAVHAPELAKPQTQFPRAMFLAALISFGLFTLGALAVAIIEELRRRGVLLMATTHYAELKVFALETKGVVNASCEFDLETLRPTYKLSVGVPGKSNAFLISEKLGIPERVIEAAQQHLSAEDKRLDAVLGQLDDLKLQLKESQDEVEELKNEASHQLEAAQKKRDELIQQGENELEAARAKARALAQQVESKAYALTDELRQLQKDERLSTQQKAQRAREIAKKESEKLFIGTEVVHNPVKEFVPLKEVKVGQEVCIAELNQLATVLALPDKNGDVLVRAGIIKTKVPLKGLKQPDKLIKEPQPKTKAQQRYSRLTGDANRPNGRVERVQRSAKMELNLLGLTVDEALPEVDAYIDRAILNGQTVVYLIHGNGTGALRTAIHKHLRGNRMVKSFRLGRYGEGESGVTVVELK